MTVLGANWKQANWKRIGSKRIGSELEANWKSKLDGLVGAISKRLVSEMVEIYIRAFMVVMLGVQLFKNDENRQKTKLATARIRTEGGEMDLFDI
jgi:hypothetical protein